LPDWGFIFSLLVKLGPLAVPQPSVLRFHTPPQAWLLLVVLGAEDFLRFQPQETPVAQLIVLRTRHILSVIQAGQVVPQTTLQAVTGRMELVYFRSCFMVGVGQAAEVVV
jgi:hypothetical protein